MSGRCRSQIWNHFEKEDTENATCNYCNRNIRITGGSTNNLQKHLRRRHSRVLNLSPKGETTRYTKNSNNRRRSIIWNYFQKVDRENATCTFCRRNIRIASGATCNLRRHIIRKHGVDFLSSDQSISATAEYNELPLADHEETKTLDQPVVFVYDDYSSELVKVKTDNENGKKQISQISLRHSKGGQCPPKKEIDDKLLMFIVHDFQPFSIVEETGFKEFCHALNPSYTVPDRTTLVEHLLPNKYSIIEDKTKELISTAQSFIVTTELWASIDSENIMAVRVHFIDHNYEQKSALLEVCTFSETCTTSDLVNDLQRVIYEWNLNEKILLVISDGTEHIKNAIIEELQFSHFSCLAYAINTIANDSLALIEPLINKVRSIVSFFSRNSLAKSKLEAFQQQNGKDPKKLIQSANTQWSSVFNMFQCILEFKEEIKASMDDYDELTDEEFEEIKQLVSILSPLYSATKSMCMLSSVIIITNGLQEVYNRLSEEKTSFSSQIKTVVQTIRRKVCEHFRDIEDDSILLVSTMLDPRFKNVGFSSEHVKEKAKKLLTNLLTNHIGQTSDSSKTLSPLSSEQEGEKDGEYSVWDFFAKKVSQIEPMEPTATNYSRALIEVQQYLEGSILSRQENPLAWWKANEHVYPYLSKLVYSKFGAVCTSVKCEQLFSKNGQVLLERRNQLSAEDIQQVLFIKENSE